MQDPYFDWGFHTGSALKEQGAGSFREERGDPIDHIGGDVLREQEGSEFRSIDIVEASFYVQEKGGYCPPSALEGAHFLDQGGTCFGGT